MSWHLYILDCDGRLYTGIARDPQRRLAEHRNGGARAARFTRGARSIELVYMAALQDRGTALRAEARVKKLSRPGKQEIVRSQPGGATLLQMIGLGEKEETA